MFHKCFFLLFYFIFSFLFLVEPNDIPYKRIVTTSIETADIIDKLGNSYSKLIVGLPYTIDDSQYSTQVKKWNPIIKRIRAEVEQIVQLKPDLVILNDYHNSHLYEALEEHKIKVIILKSSTGFNAHFTNIRFIAEVLQCSNQGKQQIDNFNNQLHDLQNHKVAKKIRDQKLKVLSYSSTYTAGDNTTFNDVVTAIGFINIAAKYGITGHQHISMEDLLIWKPDFIITNCDMEKQCITTKEQLKKQLLERHINIPLKIIAIKGSYFSATDDDMLIFMKSIINEVSTYIK